MTLSVHNCKTPIYQVLNCPLHNECRLCENCGYQQHIMEIVPK